MREPATVLTPQPATRANGSSLPGSYLCSLEVHGLPQSVTLNISVLCLSNLSPTHNGGFTVGSTQHEFCTWKLASRKKLLEKLLVLQLLKKFSVAFETLDYIVDLPKVININILFG